MKFAVVVVVLALALGAQSSVLPWGWDGHGLSYTAVSGPAVWGGVVAGPALSHGPLLAHGPALSHGPLLAHGPALSHGPLLAHGPAWGHAAVVAAAPAHVIAPIPHEGSYVAKTRGAVHTAPLAGHANSAASINVLPAPGTV